MKFHVDPRTGKIIAGRRPTPHIPRTSAEPSQAETTIDIAMLFKMAQEIGRIIAQELQVVQIGAPTSDELVHHTPAVRSVVIDESIADVGLGDVDDLKKGANSAIIVKEEIHKDDKLDAIKSRLRQLKDK